MTILGVLLGILCFSSFTFIINKSQLDKCNLFVFTGSVYLTGFVISAGTVILNKSIHAVPSAVMSLSVLAGVASVSGFIFQLVSLKTGGSLSIINIIGNMSTLIPIIYSIVVFHEEIGITKYIGIFLFIVFILLINNTIKEESK
jgi:drug/metabolite transporter (DMT)-like permease